jgi:hypothetical protein
MLKFIIHLFLIKFSDYYLMSALIDENLYILLDAQEITMEFQRQFILKYCQLQFSQLSFVKILI